MSIRSLLSGVSGLRNFQFQLDVVGNNIANSQTPGYKSSRVTFQDLLTQTIRGATAPATDGSTGGTNPQEVGLGSSVGAIDTDLTQGNILNTGRLTDLAIQGEGFYKLSDGTNIFYSRAGAFDIDSDGNLVSTTTGYIVQGYNATAGVLASSVAGIQLPVGVVLPAQETTTVSLVGNLDASSEQIGTVLQAEGILAIEDGSNDVSGLYAGGQLGAGDLNSRIAGMQSGTTTITVTDGAATSVVYTYSTATLGADEFNTLTDLANEITAEPVFAATLSATVTASGELQLTDLTGAPQAVTVTSNNSSLNTAFTDLNATIAAGGTVESDEFSHTAEGTDSLSNLRNGSGTDMSLGATINISADIGGTTTTGSQTVAGNTVDNLLSTISTSLDLQTATINNGQITVTGKGGTNYAITNMSLTDSGGSTTFDNVFDSSAGNWTSTQTAADNYSSSFIAYDTDGAQHTVTVKYNIRDNIGDEAVWQYDVESVETASGTSESVTNGSGTIRFNGDGSLGASSAETISPSITTAGIGDDIDLSIDLGTNNTHDGLVMFESANSARFAEITGYASGELQTITINTAGIVTGNFTNGQNQTLAQLVLSIFDNPSGLAKEGQNLFSATVNSGVGSDGAPNVGGRGSLIPSALEGSNVDLAQEFINLITAQRGFQTNARVITTANTILGELVSIVR